MKLEALTYWVFNREYEGTVMGPPRSGKRLHGLAAAPTGAVVTTTTVPSCTVLQAYNSDQQAPPVQPVHCVQ
jgi:hypothetical protein